MLLYVYLILYDLEIGGNNAGPCLIIIKWDIDSVQRRIQRPLQLGQGQAVGVAGFSPSIIEPLILQ